LQVKSEEKYADDACILSNDGNIAFVLEIKGVNTGLKREHINQVDSHREKLNIKTEVPGVLVINDFMDIEDFQKRKEKQFEQAHLQHAKNTNVKILRTTTLFDWMRRFEGESDRNVKFLAIIKQDDPLILPPN